MIAAKRAVLTALALFTLGCDDPPAGPSTPANGPVQVETFASTLAVGGVRFYSVHFTNAGNMSLTLISVRQGGVASDARLGIGIGVPFGTDCFTSSTANVSAGPSPQLTAVLQPGTYCARVFDTSSALTEPADFTLNIAYPK